MVIKWEEEWVEVFVILFLALGFIISIMLRNAFFSYFSAFLGGFIAARICYFKKYKEPLFPFIMIIIGFLLGYLIGGIWNNRFLIIFFFGAGFAVSYFLHMKNILVIFKSKDFIK